MVLAMEPSFLIPEASVVVEAGEVARGALGAVRRGTLQQQAASGGVPLSVALKELHLLRPQRRQQGGGGRG
eukprot:COSAG01_NODE_5176_length_4432_cov_5.631202_1_plen_71_part_00